MKLLGDDSWWAPGWMQRIQQKIGLGEPILDDERPGTSDLHDLVKSTPITDPVTMKLPVVTASHSERVAASPARRKPSTAPSREVRSPPESVTPATGPKDDHP
jgi:RND superfamily putative drug exporter